MFLIVLTTMLNLLSMRELMIDLMKLVGSILLGPPRPVIDQ